MRVSTATRYDQFSSDIRAADSRMETAQERVSSGKRIEKPSDDPSGTRQLLSIGSVKSQVAAYTKNLTTAKGVLASSESTYSDLGDLVQQAQVLAVQGATSTNDGSTLTNLAAQVQSLQDRLVTLGNSQSPDGRYLFGGQATDAKPFAVAADGSLTNSGNATIPSIETGPASTVKIGETGGAIATLYDNLTKLKASLTSGDTSALSNDRIAELKSSDDAILAARGDVGRRLDAVASSTSTLAAQDTALTSRASDIGEVDYATAIVDYTAAQQTYQAALQVASKGFSMGLMDFIK